MLPAGLFYRDAQRPLFWILDRIKHCIRSRTNVHQWRNTHSVIDWFSNIKDKSQCTFLIFDIVDFYPSISEAVLTVSLDYTRQFTTISDEDEEIIPHSRKTLLFHDNEPWVKRGDSPMVDVAMGSYDGTEVCELVGFHIQHKLTTAFSWWKNRPVQGWWPRGI